MLYDKVCYIEKKGFHLLLKAARLAERYDMAIICAEGYAVRAAKALLSAAQEERRMVIVCFHDADPYGYNIARTLREATATCPNNSIEVVDLGLGLEEAIKMGLQTETFYRKKAIPKKLVLTDFERDKFTGTVAYVKDKIVWKAERVELNALAADPDRFIEWMRKKLDAAGLKRKLVPPARKAQTEAKRRLTEALNVRVADELDRILHVTETRDRLVRRLAKKFPVETIPEHLAKWAKKMEPVPWTAEVGRLVHVRLAKQSARIGKAVEGAVEKSRRRSP